MDGNLPLHSQRGEAATKVARTLRVRVCRHTERLYRSDSRQEIIYRRQATRQLSSFRPNGGLNIPAQGRATRR